MSFISRQLGWICLGACGLLTIPVVNATEKSIEPIIVPRPQDVVMAQGVFADRPMWRVAGLELVQGLALQETPGCPKLLPAVPTNCDIVFAKASQSAGDEAYILEVTPTKVTISAQARAGWFYGFQTLLHMYRHANGAGIPCCRIIDAPRFGWRGAMVDEGRHFFGKQEIKRFLDVMAVYKLNRFHWHLTDSEGWRIEILKYPKLATIGGIGDWTAFQKDPLNPQGACHFYTQQDIREIVAYAQARCIEIIPEIDMPGHASAMNRAYPEYDGGGNKRLPRFTLNPGNDKTYAYLTDILREVATLFPASWLHFGGDEVHFANQGWQQSQDVQVLMKREQLKDLHEVEWYFNRRMASEVRKLGKICMGWDEVVAANLPTEGSLICWWRHDKLPVLHKMLDKGYAVVLCPRHPCYFDFVQDKSHKHGRRWDGFNDWQRVYTFPAFDQLGITPEQGSQIRGIQACLWSETIPSARRLEYLTFPRLQVLAESAWTQPARKDIERFRTHALPSILSFCKNQGLVYFDPFKPDTTPEVPPADLRPIEYIDPATPLRP